MDRRNVFRAALSGVFAAAAAGSARAAGASAAKVVYHLADVEKVSFVLGNVRNHVAGTGGPGRVSLAVVVHGPALHVLRAKTPNVAVTEDVRALVADSVAFFACANTMAAMGLTRTDLLPGFAVAENGGVVKLAQLQGEGWAYLRP